LIAAQLLSSVFCPDDHHTMSATVSDKKGDNEPNSDSIKPVSSTRAFGRLSRALITGCALIASLIGFSNASFRRSTTLTQFPGSYSLCSKAQNIWTVDEKKPQIECFGVHDGRIFATGSRGAPEVARSIMVILTLYKTIFWQIGALLKLKVM
jgi:hypothetical protein